MELHTLASNSSRSGYRTRRASAAHGPIPLHKIDAQAKPVYVVTGEYDPAGDDDVSGGPAVEKFIPGAKFVKAEGLGHFTPCDDPIGFGDAIVALLDEVINKASSRSTCRPGCPCSP
ncbi:alpha/beta fold hydrolase [Streptomyces sp. NPDC058307]|uniref:alpha/beta fold hydrolase n=1 Tax=Streptomyces sp. NPDC058307 TaxID=3346439 RepID=UPI0036EE4149